ncbi:subfamily B ATP-binding cassette protein HlyB/CyaB [Bradyrhizobium elkanii]|uniref:peptidase domain-containing ABC transporter n=1 Tax=Bradyrhizobium TaxID=374 RepID=UPI00216A0E64|nr:MULTISPECIES: type I secretion system permease/ATPase [Bradyrhizobium]MCS3926222.1 subfamily B ATP-binding cassette protein HlyB/CyaB [Bradyrhizobium elkanii]MCS3966774.1 subfamily B ATP-binding cassette protein HlyB/CyaB [Bradyrhizobium japonicum]
MHDKVRVDSGLAALCGIAAYYRIAADPMSLARELALQGGTEPDDLVRAAKLAGLKARIVRKLSIRRMASAPLPAIIRFQDGSFAVLGGRTPTGHFSVVDPITRAYRDLPAAELYAAIDNFVLLIQRRVGGSGVNPRRFGFQWFLASVWRYRQPLLHVVAASLFVQLFALVTPLFFQVAVDKVLPHKSYSTLLVLVGGIVAIGLFDVLLQYLRTYALAHTSNRIDVELSHRLFAHLLRLPINYFESRSAGQTIARVRELETIRNFLTGQGLFSLLDLLFAFVYIAVLEAYSVKLTWTVLAAIPAYLAIAMLVRPLLREKINEKFILGAASQQFLVEAVVGIQSIKTSAAEPFVRAQWEERLAAYVRSGFAATKLGAGGQNAIQYVSKLSSALLLLFGAQAVIDGDLTIGGLVAFNMIAGQVAQPILRLSQFWQDFQQVQISVERLGDILNAAPEFASTVFEKAPPPKGEITFKHLTFRYSPGERDALKDISLSINSGEVIGIVGPSGSGKSTLAKLIQRLYVPSEGELLLDGRNLSHIDPLWLRRQIGVVLQEGTLFNRTIHENIALANPAMPRSQIIAVARLAGADEFVAKLRQGYDTMIEERGANLSGGQRQRLLIARALATDPPILIFDEATSALDYESEQIIQANMRHIARGRTVIIIAHRLATVRHCDRIISLVDGRLVETGTHDTLLQRPQGFYARIWALQTTATKDQTAV